MDTFLLIIAIFLIPLVIFAVAGILGFKIPSIASSKWLRRSIIALVSFCVVTVATTAFAYVYTPVGDILWAASGGLVL